MLNAHADGEALALHGQAEFLQHLEGVPGGVAGGQDQGVTGDGGGVGALFRDHSDGGQAPAALDQAGELVPEADIRAQGEQFLPDGFYHVSEHVGANVGLMGPLNILRGPMGHENVENVGDAGVVHSGGQLAVGKRARAALAKLDVGGGGEPARPPKKLHVSGALVHVRAPLQHDGPQARPGQGQRGEQPRRAHPHHHGRQGGGAVHRRQYIRCVLHGGHTPGGAAEDGRFLI